MVRFTVTLERPNGTQLMREFTCPIDRRAWIKDVHSLFPKGTRVVEYENNVYLDDEADIPPEGEEQWYEVKNRKGGA